MHTTTPKAKPPLLLTLGVLVARGTAVLGLIMVACHPAGDLNVRVNGEPVERSQVLTLAYPAILLITVALLVLAHGLRAGRPWARPFTIAFWILFIGLLLWVGGRGQVLNTLGATLPIAAASLLYLYFNPAVPRYYDDLAREEAKAVELRKWLERPGPRARGA